MATIKRRAIEERPQRSNNNFKETKIGTTNNKTKILCCILNNNDEHDNDNCEEQNDDKVAISNDDISNRKVTRCNEEGADQFEDKYDVISDYMMYTEYNALYDEKYGKIQEWVRSIKANAKYFREIKTLIQNEPDAERKKQMMSEFRAIFKERGPSVKKMKNAVETIRTECIVITNRINDYVDYVEQQEERTAS